MNIEIIKNFLIIFGSVIGLVLFSVVWEYATDKLLDGIEWAWKRITK